MKATLLILVCIALWSTIRAEEQSIQDFFKTHVTELPKCDRVEVLRLDESDFFLKESELTEEIKRTSYHIWPKQCWCKVLGKKTLEGADAERLAVLYRAFRQHVYPKGMGVSICHDPPYAYRFYSGEKLMVEASICWNCDNILIRSEGEERFLFFKKESPKARQLLEVCKNLVPENQSR